MKMKNKENENDVNQSATLVYAHFDLCLAACVTNWFTGIIIYIVNFLKCDLLHLKICWIIRQLFRTNLEKNCLNLGNLHWQIR